MLCFDLKEGLTMWSFTLVFGLGVWGWNPLSKPGAEQCMIEVQRPNVGALIIRVRFCGLFYYHYSKEP